MAAGARLPGGEFTAIWGSEALSVIGDQLAKVALALLVFHDTGSAAWSGLAYGLTFLPPLITGPLLVGVADRFPRRTVMVACCLGQAACVALMAWPRLPLPAVVAGALLLAAIQTPFKAAQGAAVLDVLGAGLNKAGRARLSMVRETGQLIGLAAGAAAVGLIGVEGAFLLDAVTFAAAGVWLRLALRHRQPVSRQSEDDARGTRGLVRAVRRDVGLRRLALLIVAIGVTAVPDAVAVPFIAEAGGDSWYVGPLLAADCLGLVLAAAVIERLRADLQRRIITPLAVLSVLPLAFFAWHPSPAVAIGLLVVSGAGSAYLPLATGEFTERVARDLIGTANGLINVAVRASQGLAAITAGIAATATSAAMAVALFGAFGVILTVACAKTQMRAQALTRQCAEEGLS